MFLDIKWMSTWSRSWGFMFIY